MTSVRPACPDPNGDAPTTYPFGEQLHRAYPIIARRLLARFPRDPQLADEMCQECLARAFERHLQDPTFFLSTDLVRWTTRLAVWRALDVLRQRCRLKPLPEEGESQAGVGVRRLQENRASVCAREHTWAVLRQLPDKERLAVLGHFYDGRTDQDLGTELFGEAGTRQARGLKVWRLRQKAYTRLKALLLALGFDTADVEPVDGELVGAQAV